MSMDASGRMIPLPDPESPLAPVFGETPFSKTLVSAASGSSTWSERAAALDDLIAQGVANLIAVNCDAVEATGTLYLATTCALEALGERTIEHADQALFYLLAVHDPWRAAARAFLQGHDTAALLRTKPGVQLLWRIASARVAVLDAAEMSTAVRH